MTEAQAPLTRPWDSKKAIITVEVKKQMAEEIGEQELNSKERLALLQKYGVLAPRFERFDVRITKPEWMDAFEAEQEIEPWKKRLKGWRKAVQPLATFPQSKFSKVQKENRQGTQSASRSAGKNERSRFSRSNPRQSQRNSAQPTSPSFRTRPWQEIKHKRVSRPTSSPNSPQTRS